MLEKKQHPFDALCHTPFITIFQKWIEIVEWYFEFYNKIEGQLTLYGDGKIFYIFSSI